MELEGASWTAIACSRARACHMVIDTRPWIYEDRIAAKFVDLDRQIAEGYDLDEIKQPVFSRTRAVFLVRERYCEDALADAVEIGASQYVVLGAGLNGFAYNGSRLASRVRVFEVDHPATQTWKRRRLGEIGVPEPENAVYIPIDFAADRLSERLLERGFDPNSSAVFAWTGISQYLDDNAINSTVREIRTIACSGSALAMQIILPKHLVSDAEQRALDVFMKRAAERGEPWINSQDPAEFVDRLNRLGFAEVDVFTPRDAMKRYLGDREDGLAVNEHFSMITARIV